MPGSDPSLARLLAVLAALRLSPREVLELHRFLSVQSPESLYELLRELDRQYLSHPYVEDIIAYRRFRKEDPIVEQVFRAADEIRRNELRVNTIDFSRRLQAIAAKQKPPLTLPRFDPRRGFKNWIAAILQEVAPSKAYQLIAILREQEGSQTQRSWPLNRS